MKSLKEGLKFQAYAVKSGFVPTVVATNQLISLYSKHGLMQEAHKLFDGMPERNVFSWNTIINAYIKSRSFTKAKSLFYSSPSRDTVTYNSMISGYARSDGYESEAIELFIQMQFDNDTSRIDEFTLTTMLNLVAKLRVLCYGKQNGREEEAVELFKHMAEEGFRWNEHTFGSLLTACAALRSLKLGKEVHAWVLKEGTCLNPFIGSGLLMFIASVQCEDAFVLFREYAAQEATVPDSVILVSLLGACSIQTSVNPGKQIHAYILRTGITMNEKANSALIDMYSKCGFILYAQRLFRRVSTRDTIIYNVMIAACAHHGYENEAIHLFEEMIGQGL
ncbi:UNVERIFIED_CONTAM: putative pentatricopeptide repeat-containing protein [Sesamum radiatum]|uniref:Pentatricopeptide repeat-containing protein n=1 Tax=Sesamum radiatum TaxID=300843 RepID=A0AAW2JF75_SESRA